MGRSRSFAKLHFVVFIWSFTAILGNLITIRAVELVFFRTAIAAVAIFLWLSWRKPGALADLPGKLNFFFIGFLIGIHWVLFFLAVHVSNVSICLAGIATLSLWTALLEPMMTHKRFHWFEAVLGLLVFAALYAIFRFQFNHVTGLIIALASAFFAAVFSIFNGQHVKDNDPLSVSCYEMAGAACFCFLILPIWRQFPIASHSPLFPDLSDLFWLLLLSLGCTVYAYSAYVTLLKTLSVYTINLASNFEPVYGVLLAAFFFSEHRDLTPGFYLGTGLIVIAVFV
ncbi:MAG: DMT family transporter, partial [Verrucomicrobiota bacterium]